MLIEIFLAWKESVPLNHRFNSFKELLKISSEWLERFLRYFGRRVKKCYFEKKSKIIKTTSDLNDIIYI